MLTNTKHALTSAFTAYALVVIMAFALVGKAHAQTVGYVRPSKGQAIPIFNATSGGSAVTTQMYDWTAFDATVIAFRFAAANGTRCPCPSGVDNCVAELGVELLGSMEKAGTFGQLFAEYNTVPLEYNPTDPPTAPLLFVDSQRNVSLPYVKFKSSFTSYKDTGTGAPVAGCFLTVTVTPIAFTARNVAEGPYKAVASSISQVQPLMSGGLTYVPPGGSGNSSFVSTARFNGTGVAAVGFGSGDPLLPATSPVAVNAATLVYTATTAQRGVRLQNVGANPALCAAGANAASVAAGRYSFALAAAATAGAGGTFDVQQLDTSNSAANGKVYCLGSGGATSIAIMPY